METAESFSGKLISWYRAGHRNLPWRMTNDPYGMAGCIAVTEVDNLQKLMKHICKNGFEHHVAMVRTDVVDIIQEAVENYLGWELYLHE